jgi:hypothetical protein
MTVSRASHATAGAPAPASTPSDWEGLDLRQKVDLALPGAVIGLLGAIIAGGLAASGGLSPWLAILSILGLGVPLAAVGVTYEVLLAKGKAPLGPLAPMALVWAVGFPLSRVLHALLLSAFDSSDVVVPNGWVDFIVYNILLSVPFSIGFWWLHENFAPRWWIHLEGRNPVAARYVGLLVHSAERRRQEKPDEPLKGLAGMQERRLARRRARAEAHQERPASRSRSRR